MRDGTYTHLLESLCRAAEVLAPWGWSWFHERESMLPRPLRETLPPATIRKHVVHMLSQRLYSHFYCTGLPVPIAARTFIASGSAAKAAFVTAVSAANRRLRVNGDERAGGTPSELRFISPGFFMVMGDEPLAPDARIRLYWNLRVEGAAVLVEQLSASLNEARVPFRLKVLDDPGNYARCDAGVLYMAAGDYEDARPLVERVYDAMVPYLKGETPALTRQLGPGLGLAEEPASGESFGQHRCARVAEAMVRSFEGRHTRVGDRMDVVRGCFDEAGISVETPFLSSGSKEQYDFYWKPVPANGARRCHAEVGGDALLRTAREIGEIVQRRAIWHDDRCTWFGVAPLGSGAREHESGPRLAYQTLGAEIYGGTSGVGLFLAELYRLTGDVSARRASLGAIRHAVSTILRSAGSARRGFFDGALGVAFVAAYVGRLLREDLLLRDAGDIARRACSEAPPDGSHDVMSGTAGDVLALLLLADLVDNQAYRNVAARRGEELLRGAVLEDGRCSWRSALFPKQRHLLGLSHGAAGIACALLEIHRATGDVRYRDAALAALDYERYWFRPDAGNWPDFRGVPARSRAKDHLLDLPVFWCHGAAGIALSRLHAASLLGDETLNGEAQVALGTTLEWTADKLEQRSSGFSLCHGLAGNADILAAGSRAAVESFPAGRELAMEVAEEGIRHYAAQQHQWPLDWAGSRSPSLMLGLSGVGYFYLRLQDPEVPSVLWPEREAIMRRIGGHA